jgi:hypothetical protein
VVVALTLTSMEACNSPGVPPRDATYDVPLHVSGPDSRAAGHLDGGRESSTSADSAIDWQSDSGSPCPARPLGLTLTDSSAPLVTYSLGTARGVREMSSDQGGLRDPTPVYVWRGLRYAQSTAGANRWRPPVPAECQHGIQDATSPGSRCLQSHKQDRNRCPPSGSSARSLT